LPRREEGREGGRVSRVRSNERASERTNEWDERTGKKEGKSRMKRNKNKKHENELIEYDGTTAVRMRIWNSERGRKIIELTAARIN